MAQNKVRMPSTGAGITQYFDDYRSSVEIKPHHVVAIAIVIGLIVILLNVFGGSLVG